MQKYWEKYLVLSQHPAALRVKRERFPRLVASPLLLSERDKGLFTALQHYPCCYQNTPRVIFMPCSYSLLL